MDDVNQPFIDRGRSLLEQLVRIAQTRLELLSVEIQREKLELARTVRLVIAFGICAWLAGFSLILWIALVLPPDQRSLLLGGVFIALLAATIVTGVALRRRSNRKALFTRLIQQLDLDRASLGPQP